MSLSKSTRLAMAYQGIKNQKALAAKSDVSEATISRILKGDINISFKAIFDIAKALGYSTSHFIKLGEEGDVVTERGIR